MENAFAFTTVSTSAPMCSRITFPPRHSEAGFFTAISLCNIGVDHPKRTQAMLNEADIKKAIEVFNKLFENVPDYEHLAYSTAKALSSNAWANLENQRAMKIPPDTSAKIRPSRLG